MEQNKKILINFSLYFLTLLLIIIIGITNVFADSYDGSNFSAQLYDNLGPTLNAVSTNFDDTDNSYYGFIGLTAYSSGGAWGISSPTPLLANHTYTMTAELYTTGCGSVILSTYNRIGVGTSLANARSSYINNSYVTENYSNNTGYNLLQFAFTPSINGSYLVFAYSSTSGGNNCTSALKSVAFQDLGSSGVSETTINNSLNNQTNIINNSITASTNDITANSNANRDAIIDNQNSNNEALINNDNANTDKIIEENKKNFNDCRDSVNLFNINGNVSVIGNSNSTSTNISVSDNILTSNINANLAHGAGQQFTNLNGKTFTFSAKCTDKGTGTGCYISIYDNKVLKDSKYFTVGNYGSITYTATSDNIVVAFSTSAGTGAKYTDIQVELGSTRTDYEEYGKEICVNKLDEQNKTSKGILGKLGDLFNNLFSDDDADISGLNNMVGWLPPGPVDSIINLPLSFFNSLTNTLTGTCRAVSLNIPFVNQTLVLPCFDAYMSQYLTGFNTLWTFVGVTLSVFILYYYLLSLYKWVDDTLTFRENNLPGYYGDNWGGGA